MAVVWIIIPEMGLDAEARPQLCPFCGNHILQRWGKFSRSVHDLRVTEIELYRYRCERCTRTFRHYPPVVDQTDPTPRIRRAAGVVWVLGMSARQVVDLFKSAGINISRMTVWREGQISLERMKCDGSSAGLKPYALDSEYIPGASSKLGTVVGIQFGGSNAAVLGTVDETIPLILVECLEKAFAGFGIKVALQKGTAELVGPPINMHHRTYSSPESSRIRSQGGRFDSSARIDRNS